MTDAASPLNNRPTPNWEPPVIETTSRSGLIGKLVTWELDPKRSCCCPALFKSWTIFVIKKAFVFLDFVGIGGVCYRFAFPFLDKTLGIKIYNLASAKGFQADWNQSHRSLSSINEISAKIRNHQPKEGSISFLGTPNGSFIPLSTLSPGGFFDFIQGESHEGGAVSQDQEPSRKGFSTLLTVPTNLGEFFGGKCFRPLTEPIISTTQTVIDNTSWVAETLNYIKQVLANPEFQKNPKTFIQEWKEKRGSQDNFAIGADSALEFFNRELPGFKIQRFDGTDRASLDAMASLAAKAEIFAKERWS
jgi:hypothetical protein